MPLRLFAALFFAIIIVLISAISWYAAPPIFSTESARNATPIAVLWGLSIAVVIAMGVMLDRSIIRPLLTLTKTAKGVETESSNAEKQAFYESDIRKAQDALKQMTSTLAEREKLLEDREQRFTTLFQRIPDAVFVFDVETFELEEANPAALELFGYAHDEFMELKLLDLSAELEETRKALAALNADKLTIPVSRIFRRKDGETFSSEIYPSLFIHNKRRKCVAVVQDVSARDRMQSELLQSVERLKELDFIVNLSPMVVFLWKAKENWPVEYVSENIRHFGYTPDDFYSGRVPYASIVHANDLSRVGAEVASYSKDPACHDFSQEYRILSPDGRVFTIDDRTWIRRNNKGEITHYQGVILDITDRKQAENDLRASRDMLRLIIENIPVRVFWKDENLRYLGCNTLFAHDAGMQRPDDLLGKNDYQMGWCEQAELYRADDQKVIDSGTPILSYDEPQTTPDGSKIWLRTSKVPLHRADGTASGVLGIYEDITERKLVELALRESEAQLREAQGIAHLGSWSLDLVTNKLTWSDENCRIFGFDPETVDATYETFLETVHPDDREFVDRAYRGSVKNRTPYDIEHRLLMKDGRVKWVNERGQTFYDERHTPIHSSGVTFDITERKMAELKIREALQKLDLFRRTVDQSADMLLVNDTQTGRFIDANETACARLGYTREELLDLKIEDVAVDLPKNFSWSHYVGQLRKAKRDTMQARAACKDGTSFPIEVGVTYVALEHRDVIIAVVRDITERIETERALRYSQKIDSLGNLAGGVAHNMNNLLLPILSLTQMTLTDLPEGGRARKRLEKVVEAAIEAKSLVQQILDFSRRNTSQDRKEALDIQDSIKQALSLVLVSVPSSVNIVEDIGAEGVKIFIDRDQISTVVMNLVSNAVDAFEGRVGTLTISLSEETIGAHEAAGIPRLKPGRYAKLSVIDTGKGMDEKMLERVFDPFFTTKEVGKGSGLGLSVVHGIAERAGGAITIDSKLQSGTVVAVYLPISPNDSPDV